jgi:hypothetical protein
MKAAVACSGVAAAVFAGAGGSPPALTGAALVPEHIAAADAAAAVNPLVTGAAMAGAAVADIALAGTGLFGMSLINRTFPMLVE